MHHLVIVGTVVVGLLAVGFALFSLFEDERPQSRGRPRRPPSPPRRRPPSPPRRRPPGPPPTPQNPPPTHPLSSRRNGATPLSSPNPTSSDHRQTPNENHPSNSRPDAASNSVVSQESPSRHEDAPVASRSRDTRALHNENGSPHCYSEASECTNCEDDSAYLVTFLPCGGSYFCRECAMQYLERNEHCSLCRKRITSME